MSWLILNVRYFQMRSNTLITYTVKHLHVWPGGDLTPRESVAENGRLHAQPFPDAAFGVQVICEVFRVEIRVL
jgi:hypothetical protein